MLNSITYKNSEVFYHQYGHGIPVVLLHGFGESSRIWQNQINHLKNICRLIVPDFPGSGESPSLDIVPDEMFLTEFADCIYLILQDENADQCILLGHSMGGYIVLEFVEKYPALVKAFGLINSTAFADAAEKKQNRLRGIETIKSYGSFAFLKVTIPDLFAESYKQKNAKCINELIESGKHFEEKSLQQYYYAMMKRPDRTHVLKNSDVPVLFVLAIEDMAAPINDLLKQVHLPGISYIHILEETGHMSMLEAPDKLNEYVENFINETK